MNKFGLVAMLVGTFIVTGDGRAGEKNLPDNLPTV
jgi:hypothetical protein